MIPLRMKQFLQAALPKSVWKNRLLTDGPFCFLEFGPLDVDRLKRLGIRVDRLGPRLVVCMWNQDSPVQIGGFLVVDNLAMGQPAMKSYGDLGSYSSGTKTFMYLARMWAQMMPT